MATERQIAANQRNAARSTGPRSTAGKRRTRTNAFRHGFGGGWPHGSEPGMEELARKFAGDADDPITLELARTAAHAELILAEIKRLKVAWIQRAYALGFTVRPEPFATVCEIRRIVASKEYREQVLNPLGSMPNADPERTAEAVRRALRDLSALDRYEARAASRRDRALRELVRRRPHD